MLEAWGPVLKMMELLWIYISRGKFPWQKCFSLVLAWTPWLRADFSGTTGRQTGSCSCCPLSPTPRTLSHRLCRASTGTATESGKWPTEKKTTSIPMFSCCSQQDQHGSSLGHRLFCVSIMQKKSAEVEMSNQYRGMFRDGLNQFKWYCKLEPSRS